MAEKNRSLKIDKTKISLFDFLARILLEEISYLVGFQLSIATRNKITQKRLAPPANLL
jgi:hypothetical protein